MHSAIVHDPPSDQCRQTYKRVENATAMIWKLLTIAQKTWRTLKGLPLLRDVYDGKRFIDGEIAKKVQKAKEMGA